MSQESSNASSTSLIAGQEKTLISLIPPRLTIEQDHVTSVAPLSANRLQSVQFDLPPVTVTRPDIFRYTTKSACALLIGNMVGSGLFASPGIVLREVGGSAGGALAVWLFAGVVALMGAVCYAELGTKWPDSGGDVNYLLRAYGPLAAFMYTWAAVLVMGAGGNAVVALTCSQYLAQVIIYFFPFLADTSLLDDKDDPMPLYHAPSWLIQSIAIISCILLALAHSRSSHTGPKVQSILTVLKMSAVIVLALTGIVISLIPEQIWQENFVSKWPNKVKDALEKHDSVRRASLSDWFESEAPVSAANYARALYAALWAYDGFNALNFVAAEIDAPTQTVPRALSISVPVVAIGYTFVNFAYVMALPLDVVAHAQAVAVAFGKVLYGNVIGSIVLPLVVALAALGALNGSMIAGARLVQTAAQQGHLPSYLSHSDKTHGTPIRALLFQTSITLVYVLIGGQVSTLLHYAAPVLWCVYCASSLSVLVLRYKKVSSTERNPFVAPTWIVTLFIAIAGGLVIVPLSDGGSLEYIAAGACLAATIPMYYLKIWYKSITHRNTEFVDMAVADDDHYEMQQTNMTLFEIGDDETPLKLQIPITNEQEENVHSNSIAASTSDLRKERPR